VISPKMKTESTPASKAWLLLVSSVKTAAPGAPKVVASREDAHLGGAVAGPVADDDAVGGDAELEAEVVAVQLVVVVRVQDEQAGAEAVAGVAKTASLVTPSPVQSPTTGLSPACRR